MDWKREDGSRVTDDPRFSVPGDAHGFDNLFGFVLVPDRGRERERRGVSISIPQVRRCDPV